MCSASIGNLSFSMKSSLNKPSMPPELLLRISNIDDDPNVLPDDSLRSDATVRDFELPYVAELTSPCPRNMRRGTFYVLRGIESDIGLVDSMKAGRTVRFRLPKQQDPSSVVPFHDQSDFYDAPDELKSSSFASGGSKIELVHKH